MTPQMTTAAVTGAVNARSWPADRPTDEVIAERMLMSALLNYRRAMTRQAGTADFKTWDSMSDIEIGFYADAVPKAYAAIFGGR